jgi:hypothetical protein
LARRLAQFGEAPYAFILQVDSKGGGTMGASSNWFGQTIIWNFLKPDHPWIGIRVPAAQ